MSATLATTQDDELLTVDTVGEHLVSTGLIRGHEEVSAAKLGGGVSNVVLSVTAGADRFVVKQSLERLRVQDEWLAPRGRILTEARAARLTGELTRGAVPEVFDVDRRTGVIVIEHAPADWRAWKHDLLAGRVNPFVGGSLGRLLAVWHRRTLDDPAVAGAFDETEAFDALRIDPYHRTVARRHPDLAGPVDDLLSRMAGSRRCLVHGDFSPKNVLVGPSRLWLIDFEVAHHGDPTFDIAFLLNHLLLKAIHRPASRSRYEETAHRFVSAYDGDVPETLKIDEAHLLDHLGCLLMARVDGKSPVEYLEPEAQDVARTLGRSLLLDPPPSLDRAWARLEELAG